MHLHLGEFLSRVLCDSIGHYVGRSVRPSVRPSFRPKLHHFLDFFLTFLFILNISRLIKVKFVKYFQNYSKNFEDFLSS